MFSGGIERENYWTILWQPTNRLSVFDHFVRLAPKELKSMTQSLQLVSIVCFEIFLKTFRKKKWFYFR